MSEIELKPCSNVGGALQRLKLLRSYCEITAKLLRKMVDE